jgi:uncharacterized protein (TIGR01777 family)
VRIVSRTGGIRDGARVEISVPVLGPIGIPWVLTHSDYRDGEQFRDQQVSGPFARWSHTHRVRRTSDTTSELSDEIDFALPLAGLGIGDALVRAQLGRLFHHRHLVTAGDLTRHAAAALPPLRIAISGATGMIGSALDAFLSTGGHAVQRIVRRAPDPTRAHPDIVWDPSRGTIDAAALEGLDAVIHLAGATVAERWTPEHKRAIRESRTQGTTLLATTLARLTRKPATFISASAIGIYGERGDTQLTEASNRGTGFLSDVADAWEHAADVAADAGIRVVHPRTGIVLSPTGGALAKQLPLFQLGAGGRVGPGTQYQSWIALDDMLGAFLFVLATPSLRGAVNFTAPDPVTNAEFTRVLGAVLHRPTLATAPAFALRLVFGREMADEVLLASTRAVPRALLDAGFAFRHPSLEGALRFELGRP